MKALVCVVMLFVLLSSGTTSDSERYGVDLFMSKLFFRQNGPPEIPSAKTEIDSHGEKQNESLKEVQEKLLELEKSLKERDDLLQSTERSMKQVEDYVTDRYETLPDKLAELEHNRTSINDSPQESMETSVQEHYESVQSTLMELESNITARNVSLQEIKRSIKAKDNTLQEMMRNMARLEEHSKDKHEELEDNFNKLQNETEFIKNSSIRSCKDVSSNESGTYAINLGRGHFKRVYCEQTAFGGGWIVFQYRFNGQVDFYRAWDEYRDGFGTIDGEFWLGLKYLHQLTSTRKHELMVEVKDYYGNNGYAKYDHFEIGSEEEKFVLKIGNYSGTAGDSMEFDQGMKFTTKDSDNDNDSSVQCAKDRNGAWWYNGCTYANLNGPYGNLSGEKAMYWILLKNDYRGMVYSKMMLREID